MHPYETLRPLIRPLNRRALVAGTTALLTAGSARAQSVLGGTQPAPVPLAPAPVQAAPQAAPSVAPGAASGSAIELNNAHNSPIPVSIPPFLGSGGSGDQLGREIADVVTADLQNCGLFRPVLGQPDAGEVPNFATWKGLGTQALVSGRVTDSGGSVRVEFRLWDVLTGQQIQGTAFSTTGANWRRIAHKIADVVYERLLGDKGYFDTRIVYVAATGPKDRRTKRLAIMDQDGENNRILTDGSYLALTPRFSPIRDQIAFMSYANNKPRVYLFDLATGRQSSLGDFGGITLSPRFSPDGGSLAMAQTTDSGADIYVVDLGTRQARKLTDSGAIDVSPCYSPDGSQIVFNSDRGGDQQLYVLGAGGGGAKRISFGRGRYATPVWSPRGDLIAFTRISGGNFSIGVMHPDGSGERILSESYYVEGPTFAPNGRVIMFYRDQAGRNPASRLVSIDINGFNERVRTTPTDATDPAWSPLLA